MKTEFKTGVIKPMQCLNEAWTLIKPQYWILFAVTLVGIMIGGITFYILLGSMMCGIYYCYLQVIDGGKAELDSLFKNFKAYFLPSLPVIILFVVPMLIAFSFIYAPFLLALTMGTKLSESELISLLVGGFAVDVVVVFIMACLHTLLMFAFPLIVDRNLSGWQAIKLSAKSVWKNLGGVTGIWALMFIVNFLGFLAFCIGIYLTIPIIIAMQAVAYRKVFPNNNQRFSNPPPPDAYRI